MIKYNDYKLNRVSFGILGDAKNSIKLGEVLYILKAIIMLAKLGNMDQNYDNLRNYVTDIRKIYASKNISNVYKIMQYLLCNSNKSLSSIKMDLNYSSNVYRELEILSDIMINPTAFIFFSTSVWKNISSVYFNLLQAFNISSSCNFEPKKITYYIPMKLYSSIYFETNEQKFQVKAFIDDISSWLKYNLLAEIKEYYVDKEKNLVLTFEINYLSQCGLT